MLTPDQERCHSESFNKHFKLFKQDVNTEQRQVMRYVFTTWICKAKRRRLWDGYIRDPKKVDIYIQKSADCYALGSARVYW
jgi:hypothetical protein